jgi:hypothetical protein
MLWGYERVGKSITLPPSVKFTRGELNLKEKMTAQDWNMNLNDLSQRKELTEVQRFLMLESLDHFHQKSIQHNTSTIFHLFIHTTPDWYIDEVTKLIQQSIEETGVRAVVLGRVPVEGSYAGNVLNNHSGLHFTAKFNQFWAEAVLDSLRHYGIP